MRPIATFFAAAVVTLGFAATAQAGLLELPFDAITRHRDCAVEPCRGNNLHYQQVWVRDRYLRFDIHTSPAQYELRRQRVMVAPPGIVVTGGRHDTDWFHLSPVVEFPVGSYRVTRPAKYVWVTQEVLVHPAQNYVTRRRPYYAYYPDSIIVTGK